jgi:hypothetical protein
LCLQIGLKNGFSGIEANPVLRGATPVLGDIMISSATEKIRTEHGAAKLAGAVFCCPGSKWTLGCRDQAVGRARDRSPDFDQVVGLTFTRLRDVWATTNGYNLTILMKKCLSISKSALHFRKKPTFRLMLTAWLPVARPPF